MRDSPENDKTIRSSCKSMENFCEWVQAFKDKRQSITGDSRSGRPQDVSTPETIQPVKDIIRSDKRVILDKIATNL